MENKYGVYWVSPRGFSNEGYYLSDDKAAIRNYLEDLWDDTSAVINLISDHDTLDAAKKAAYHQAMRRGMENFTIIERNENFNPQGF